MVVSWRPSVDSPSPTPKSLAVLCLGGCFCYVLNLLWVITAPSCTPQFPSPLGDRPRPVPTWLAQRGLVMPGPSQTRREPETQLSCAPALSESMPGSPTSDHPLPCFFSAGL